MVAFRHTFLHCGLVDLGFRGYRFTWRNGCYGAAFVEERLDRFVATIEWRELFPKAIVHHLAVAYSDHDLILLDLVPAIYPQRRRCRIQRFEEKWVTHPNCENIIRDSWSQAQPRGNLMFCLFEKIKKCWMDLIAWSR